MGKIGEYNPTEKFKNYSRPTSKPLRSQALYQEKVWTLQDQINKKLKIITKLLKSLSPKLTDDFDKHVKTAVDKNLEILIKNLDLVQESLQKDPSSFKTNQERLAEMKTVCDNLQVFRSYEHESKNLSKIKHALNELEHLIQPTKFEKKLEEQRAKNKPKPAAATQKKPLAAAPKKKPLAAATTKKPLANPKKAKALPEKTKLKAKLPIPKKSKKTTRLKR